MAQQRIRDETGIEDTKKKEEKDRKKENEGEKKKEESKEYITSIVRILSTDIPGGKKVNYGLTRIKGVSFSLANAICNSLGIQYERKVSSLSEDEIKKITEFVINPKLPSFLLNRRKDIETGEDKHLVMTNLELQKDFDIRRLKKIRSYRGWRHALGQPVRGQRTKSHFRHGKTMGVIKTKQKPSASQEKKGREKD